MSKAIWHSWFWNINKLKKYSNSIGLSKQTTIFNQWWHQWSRTTRTSRASRALGTQYNILVLSCMTDLIFGYTPNLKVLSLFGTYTSFLIIVGDLTHFPHPYIRFIFQIQEGNGILELQQEENIAINWIWS